MSHSLAQGDQSRSQVLFLWTALRKLLACSFWGFWDSITSIAQVSIRWKVSNQLHSWHLITVKSNYSRTTVCAVHIFTSVAQCIGSILSWVSFRESSENLLADIEFCIQFCSIAAEHVVRQTCIEVPAKQMSVENPLDSANLRGTINFACLFLLRKYINYWLQFWMFLMSIGPICSSPFLASCSAQNPQTW